MAYRANKKVSPRKKWNSLQAINRIPEVEKERKLNEIIRDYAQLKRDARIEETKLWDEMFADHQILKNSIVRGRSRDEVVRRLVIVRKSPEPDQPQPYSERYREFIIFKARMMGRIFGNKRTTRPRYRDLYTLETGPELQNAENVQRLLKKHQDARLSDQQRLQALMEPDLPEHARLSLAADVPITELSSRRRKSVASKVYNREAVVEGSSYNEPAYKLPSISDRFQSRGDRSLKKSAAVAADEESSELPTLPEVVPLAPERSDTFVTQLSHHSDWRK